MRIILIAFFICQSAVGFCQVDLQKGLKLYYPFSGNITDSSGNNNNPLKSKTELTEDRFGNPNSACRFNGKNSFISVKNAESLNMDDQISLCVWIKPTGFYKGDCHVNSIIMKGNQSSQNSYFLRYDDNIYRHDGNCYARLDQQHQNFSSHGTNFPAYEHYVQLQKWQCVIYTYDGKFAKVYIDGKQVKEEESTLVTYYFKNKDDLFIGKTDHPAFPYWLNADLDDLRIYDRAIHQDEVNAIAGIR